MKGISIRRVSIRRVSIVRVRTRRISQSVKEESVSSARPRDHKVLVFGEAECWYSVGQLVFGEWECGSG